MKVDFSQLIVDLENQPISDNQGDPAKSGPALTLARVCVNALLAIYRGEETDGTEKLRRFNLAQRITGGGEAELAADDIVLLKTLVNKMYGPLVVGRAYNMLDPVGSAGDKPGRKRGNNGNG